MSAVHAEWTVRWLQRKSQVPVADVPVRSGLSDVDHDLCGFQ